MAPRPCECGRAHDHLLAPLEEEPLVVHQPLELARGERCEQPVVGDVVDDRPSGANREPGIGRIVDPDQGGVETEDTNRVDDLALERPVRERPDDPGEPLPRPQHMDAWRHLFELGLATDRPPVSQLVDHVVRGGDIEHSEGGLEVDQLVHEDPNPPTDLTPTFE